MNENALPALFQSGHRVELGNHTFSADEIIRFAGKFDPQPFHLDAEAARKSVLGALCASGWHTTAVWMRKMRDYQAREAARAEAGLTPKVVSGPSPGFKNLKWLLPVYAGDTISFFHETTACRKSSSRPGWYVVTGTNSGVNQHGKPVMQFESTGLMEIEEQA